MFFPTSMIALNIYMYLTCSHISFEINMSLIQTTCPPPPEDQERLRRGAPHTLVTSVVGGTVRKCNKYGQWQWSHERHEFVKLSNWI
jgi:hypothetical protein